MEMRQRCAQGGWGERNAPYSNIALSRVDISPVAKEKCSFQAYVGSSLRICPTLLHWICPRAAAPRAPAWHCAHFSVHICHCLYLHIFCPCLLSVKWRTIAMGAASSLLFWYIGGGVKKMVPGWLEEEEEGWRRRSASQAPVMPNKDGQTFGHAAHFTRGARRYTEDMKTGFFWYGCGGIFVPPSLAALLPLQISAFTPNTPLGVSLCLARQHQS